MNEIALRRFFARHLRANQWVLRLLTAALITLKAVGAIQTPWLVVLAPVWGVPAMSLLTLLVVIMIIIIVLVSAFVLRPWLR